MDRYDFTLSAEMRDQIIFGEPIDWGQRPNGIEHFSNLDIATLKQLNDLGYLNLKLRQNDSPTIGQFMEFMKEYPAVKCHGYVVSPFRNDYRVSIEGLECYTDLSDIQDDFEQFNNADEFEASDERLYCWYD